VSWEDVDVLPTPNGFVWRSIMTGTAAGGPLRVHTCVVVTLSDDGKVARADEYLDSAALGPLTG
jgi:ketosteroid isomerase-like protein